MEPLAATGKLLILAGAVLVVLGLLLTAGPKLPGFLAWLGRLPGDIRIEGKSGVFFFPLATCLLVSALVSLLLWFLRR